MADRTLSSEKLREIINRITDVVHPERIIMFGSAARGEMDQDSDVDLLVIKSGEYNQNKLTKEIYINMIGIEQSVDVILATPEQVEKYKDINYLIIAPALKEGKEVYHA
ncbi:MAG: nucleotidyltransferase domain-containing protein [Candidatus Poribacteria bacterium]